MKMRSTLTGTRLYILVPTTHQLHALLYKCTELLLSKHDALKGLYLYTFIKSGPTVGRKSAAHPGDQTISLQQECFTIGLYGIKCSIYLSLSDTIRFQKRDAFVSG